LRSRPLLQRRFCCPCDNCTPGGSAHRTSFVLKPHPRFLLFLLFLSSVVKTMSSQLSDAPHSIRPPLSSPPRHKHAVTRSITEASSLPKLHRSNHSNIHRHNGKDRDKHQDKNEKSTTSPNPTLQPNALLTSVEAGAPRSEGATPANSQTVSRRTSLLGMNRDQDGAIPTLKVEGKTPKEVELGEERERGVLRASFVSPYFSALTTFKGVSVSSS
jgi:hypothetical protein